MVKGSELTVKNEHNPNGVRVSAGLGWICIGLKGTARSEVCREGREAPSWVCDEVASS